MNIVIKENGDVEAKGKALRRLRRLRQKWTKSLGRKLTTNHIAGALVLADQKRLPSNFNERFAICLDRVLTKADANEGYVTPSMLGQIAESDTLVIDGDTISMDKSHFTLFYQMAGRLQQRMNMPITAEHVVFALYGAIQEGWFRRGEPIDIASKRAEDIFVRVIETIVERCGGLPELDMS